MVNKERKVSATRFWRFVFPFMVLVILLASIFFILAIPDTLLLVNTITTSATKGATNTISALSLNNAR